jgi:sec-independent protein translocase protein TatA
MGGTSIWHWVVVGLIVMLLFGRGKISELMGDVAKGIKSFKKGMAEEDAPAVTTTTTGTTTTEPVRTLEHQPGATTTTSTAPLSTTTTPLGSTDRKVG